VAKRKKIMMERGRRRDVHDKLCVWRDERARKGKTFA
jgi:hypothetical protein